MSGDLRTFHHPSVVTAGLAALALSLLVPSLTVAWIGSGTGHVDLLRPSADAVEAQRTEEFPAPNVVVGFGSGETE